MSSKKAKWKESFQKAKSLSQTSLSLSSSRKTSIADEETSAKELEQYLETLNRKSGIKALWSGSSFERVVRDEEDKTPDISISSGEGDEPEELLQSEDGMDSDDFRPNIVMLSGSPSLTSEDHSGVNLMQGIQMVEFALSADEISDNQLNNSNIDNRLKSLSLEEKNVKSITNDLSQEGEIGTEDEVEEEIAEEEINESVISEASASDGKNKSKHNKSYESRTENAESLGSNRSVIQTAENSQSHSYTEDFSVASDQTISDGSFSRSPDSRTISKSSRGSASHGSRSSRSSRSYSSRSHSSKSYSSLSSQSSKSRSHKEHSSHRKSKKSSKYNRYTHDIGIQTNMAAETFMPTELQNQFHSVPPGLGVGMATSGPRLGMDYVDPSPIATHVIAAEAMEAMTAYNPAVVALNDMLRQQIKLVEQFTESNRRMYEAYTRNQNSSYKYTTLEDTMEFIRTHRPKTITMEEALRRVKRDDG